MVLNAQVMGGSSGEDEVFSTKSFAELGLGQLLASHIETFLGFNRPTLTQSASIPQILGGRDVLVKADTGSGKTLSYLAPVIDDLQKRQPKITRADGTFAVVLAPTRELCLQISAAAQQLTRRFVWIVPGHAIGGEKREKEKARFRKGITVLVATPGRLLDHLRHTAAFDSSNLRWLVLDEADRLLDLGFERDIKEILQTLRLRAKGPTFGQAGKGEAPGGQIGRTETAQKFQTVLLSATLSARVSELADISLVDPVRVGLGADRGQGRRKVLLQGREEGQESFGEEDDERVGGQGGEGEGARRNELELGDVADDDEEEADDDYSNQRGDHEEEEEEEEEERESEEGGKEEGEDGEHGPKGVVGRQKRKFEEEEEEEGNDEDDDEGPLFLQSFRAVSGFFGSSSKSEQSANGSSRSSIEAVANGGRDVSRKQKERPGAKEGREFGQEEEDGRRDAPTEASLRVSDFPEASGRDDLARDEAFQIPSQLQQFYIRVPCRLRLAALLAFLRSKTAQTVEAKADGSFRNPKKSKFSQARHAACKPSKVVVFFSTCDSVEFHHKLISEFRFRSKKSSQWTMEEVFEGQENSRGGDPFISSPIFKLHGNMPQKERSASFVSFCDSTEGILLCTDVASRGLDFPSVTTIVQFDSPGEAEEYVHRVGRTARLGRKGEAMLFLLPSEHEYITNLANRKVMLSEKPLVSILDNIPADYRRQTSQHASHRSKDELADNHFGASILLVQLETYVSSDYDLTQLAMDSFRSFVRAYAAHKGSLKAIFHPKRLHLGHVAKSFGLSNAPSLLGKSSTKVAALKLKKEAFKKRDKRRRPAVMQE